MTHEDKKVTNEEAKDLAGGAAVPGMDANPSGPAGPGPIDGSGYQLPGDPAQSRDQPQSGTSDNVGGLPG